MRIRDVYPSDPESEFFHPGSASKNLSIFSPKNCFEAFGNMIRDVRYPSRIPDPGVKMHSIPDPDPQHWLLNMYCNPLFVYLLR
jgi:hypothetical protein